MFDPLPHFKALADETRLRLLNVLSRHELNVNELVQILEMGQSRISRHLKILTTAGLLSWRRDGLWIFYSAPHEGLARGTAAQADPGHAGSGQTSSGHGGTGATGTGATGTGVGVFLQAVLPFVRGIPTARADLDMAAGMIEERAHKTRQFFNAIAEDWDKLSREVLGGFDLPGEIRRRLPECGVAADLGCGTGGVLLAMRDKAKLVIGVDGSARMLELARRRLAGAAVESDTTGVAGTGGTGTGSAGAGAAGTGAAGTDTPGVSLRIGDLSHLPLRDGEAEAATLNMVLHHVPSPLEALLEARRVLSAHGLLVVTDFDSHQDEAMRAEYGDHWLGFTAKNLLALLTRAGFRPTAQALAPVERGLSLHIIEAHKEGA